MLKFVTSFSFLSSSIFGLSAQTLILFTVARQQIRNFFGRQYILLHGGRRRVHIPERYELLPPRVIGIFIAQPITNRNLSEVTI